MLPNCVLFPTNAYSITFPSILLSRYLCRQARQDLAAKLCMTEKQVKIWYQNRRMKEKRRPRDEREEELVPQSQFPPPYPELWKKERLQ